MSNINPGDYTVRNVSMGNITGGLVVGNITGGVVAGNIFGANITVNGQRVSMEPNHSGGITSVSSLNIGGLSIGGMQARRNISIKNTIRADSSSSNTIISASSININNAFTARDEGEREARERARELREEALARALEARARARDERDRAREGRARERQQRQMGQQASSSFGINVGGVQATSISGGVTIQPRQPGGTASISGMDVGGLPGGIRAGGNINITSYLTFRRNAGGTTTVVSSSGVSSEEETEGGDGGDQT